MELVIIIRPQIYQPIKIKQILMQMLIIIISHLKQ